MQAGEWWHSIDHDEPCRVVNTDTLWGQETCLVWLPRPGTAVRVLQKRLAPLKSSDSHLLDRLSYVSAAARIAAVKARIAAKAKEPVRVRIGHRRRLGMRGRSAQTERRQCCYKS